MSFGEWLIDRRSAANSSVREVPINSAVNANAIAPLSVTARVLEKAGGIRGLFWNRSRLDDKNFHERV